MKFDFGDGNVFLPIAEAKLRGGVACSRMTMRTRKPLGFDFEKHLVDGFAFRAFARNATQSGGRRPAVGRWGRSRRAGWKRVGLFDATAQFGEIGFPGKERERGAPVGALRQLGAADGVVGGNVEPDVGAVDQE